MIINLHNSAGEKIRSVGDWLRLAPPKKKEKHWKPGRSAFELAQAWVRTKCAEVPEAITRILKGHPCTASLALCEAIPEKRTRLDKFRGERRNHDLVAWGCTKDAVKILVGIEAKADESFGPLVSKVERTGRMKPGSNLCARVDLLCQALFGRKCQDGLRTLRYQLLTGLAGTVIEAGDKEASLAVFLVHEFATSLTTEKKLQGNSADSKAFVAALPCPTVGTAVEGRLIGPI